MSPNYVLLSITGYLINFGIPLVSFILICLFGGTYSALGFIEMLICITLCKLLYIAGLIFLIILIIELFTKKNGTKIKTSLAGNIGIIIFFVPIIGIWLTLSIFTAKSLFRL